MFSVEDRERLRSDLISEARTDSRLSGAALLGSGAAGREDRWSDVDLALSVSGEADRATVIADWTKRMYGEHEAVHHLDVSWGTALYRVFLLARIGAPPAPGALHARSSIARGRAWQAEYMISAARD